MVEIVRFDVGDRQPFGVITYVLMAEQSNNDNNYNSNNNNSGLCFNFAARTTRPVTVTALQQKINTCSN